MVHINDENPVQVKKSFVWVLPKNNMFKCLLKSLNNLEGFFFSIIFLSWYSVHVTYFCFWLILFKWMKIHLNTVVIWRLKWHIHPSHFLKIFFLLSVVVSFSLSQHSTNFLPLFSVFSKAWNTYWDFLCDEIYIISHPS